MLALILLAALLLTAWRIYVAPYEAQLRTMQLVERLGGSYQADPAPDWMSRLGGANYQIVTSVSLAECDEPSEFLEALTDLPSLACLVVGGVNFSDDELLELRKLRRLELLVLDSTVVTDAALEGLREALPDLHVYRSDRRLIQALPKEFLNFLVVRRDADALLAQWQTTVEEAIETGLEDRTLLPQLAQCHRLEKLTLGSREFEDGDMAHLAGLNSLRELMVLPWFNDADAVHLAGLTRLERLDLPDSQIGDAALAPIGRLLNLQHLNLRYTQVGDAGLAHLAGLKNLKELHLLETQVSDDGLKELRGLTKLQRLNLSGTRVTDAGLVHLVGLENLEYLDSNRCISITHR